MKRMPKLGERVRFTGNWQTMQGVTGTVVRLFPGYVHRDADGAHVIDDAVSVRPDTLPENWPYPGNDCFAPSISEISPIKGR